VRAGHAHQSDGVHQRDGLSRHPASRSAGPVVGRRGVSQGEPAIPLSVDEARRRVEGLRIEVPGSSANLGPGFDALAAAARLYLRATVRRVLDGPRNELRCSFAGVALEGDNYVARSVDTLARREGVDYPALDVNIESEIPMQGGLGSSAAATVAGLV